MTDHRKTRRTAVVAAVAAAAVAGGAWFAMSQSRLPETTLDTLFDACTRFAETGKLDALAALGVPVQGTGRIVAEFAVEGGFVSVELREIVDEGRINQCEVWGARRGDPDAFTNPGLSWRAAKARTDAWFDRRAAMPGMAKLKVVALPENHSLVACPKKDEGYALGAGTIGMTLTPPVDFADQPLRFHAGRSKQQRDMACRMAGRAGSGG